MTDDLTAPLTAAAKDELRRWVPRYEHRAMTSGYDTLALLDEIDALVARCEQAEAERDNAEHLALAERKVASDGAIAVNILRAKCDVLSARYERAEADADRLREAIRRVQARGMYLGLDMDIALTLSDEAVAQR